MNAIRAMQPKLHSQEQSAGFHEAGLWRDKLIVDHVDGHASTQPDKVAIIDSRGAYSFATVQRRSENLAAALVAMGVGHGDVIAARAPNWAELPLCHLAANRVGAIYLPISEGFGEAELSHLLRGSRARVLLTNFSGDFDIAAWLAEARHKLPNLAHVVALRASAQIADCSFDDLVSAEAWRESNPGMLTRTRASPDDPSHIMTSSGTTGMPKCSLFSDNNTLVKVLLQYCGGIARLTPDDIAAALAPAGTGSTGYNYPILAPLLLGATSVMLEHWSGREPEAALKLIERHRCTFAVAVPTQIAKLITVPDIDSYDLDALRLITNSGAKLPAPVAERAEALLGCVIQSIYGSSEAGAITMTSVTDPREKRMHTAGRILLGQELEIRDEAGVPLGVNQVGEVCWRGPNKSYGFLNDPEGTRAVWSETGWLASGDLGVLDGEGYLRIVGRKKDMIIRGGQNINPRVIEEILLRHALVADVAVVPVPDSVLGERVGAFVVPAAASHPSLEALARFIVEQGIAKWNQPERLFLIDELPRNAGGKVDKAALARMCRLEQSQSAVG